MGDHISYRYEVVSVLGRGSFGQASVGAVPHTGCVTLLAAAYHSASPACTPRAAPPPTRSPGTHHPGAGAALQGPPHRRGRGPEDHPQQEALPEAGGGRGGHPGAAARAGAHPAQPPCVQALAPASGGRPGPLPGGMHLAATAGGAAGQAFHRIHHAPPASCPSPASCPIPLLRQDPDDSVNIVRTHDSFTFRCGGPASRWRCQSLSAGEVGYCSAAGSAGLRHAGLTRPLLLPLLRHGMHAGATCASRLSCWA